MVDKIKLIAGIALAVAGLWAYYWFADLPIIVRVLVVAGGFLAGAGVAYTSEPGQRFAVFVREAHNEVKKVVWPTRKETLQTTAAVFAFVVVMAVFLWLTDKTLEWVLYELVLGWKKSA